MILDIEDKELNPGLYKIYDCMGHQLGFVQRYDTETREVTVFVMTSKKPSQIPGGRVDGEIPQGLVAVEPEFSGEETNDMKHILGYNAVKATTVIPGSYATKLDPETGKETRIMASPL